jgi:hypothetical protein
MANLSQLRLAGKHDNLLAMATLTTYYLTIVINTDTIDRPAKRLGLPPSDDSAFHDEEIESTQRSSP